MHIGLLFLLAASTLVAAAWMLPRVIVGARARRFEIEEREVHAADRRDIADKLEIPEVRPSKTKIIRRLDDLGQSLTVLHDEANRLQGVYHARVARCVSSLGLALAVLGLSLTVFRSNHDFEVFAVFTEVMTLILALHQWWAARVANHRWIVARTKVELLRQWMFLQAFLQPAGAEARAGAQRAFDAKAAELDEILFEGQPTARRQWIATMMRPGPTHLTETLERRVQQYWDKLRARFAAMAPSGDLAPDDIHLYLRRRPVRQLAWFRLAKERLHRSAKLREVAMAALFVASVVLAAGKAALVLFGSHTSEVTRATVSGGPIYVELVAMGLLAVTTVSAALTSLYLSRNDRSLLHRYATQERSIEDWLERVLEKSSASDPQRRFRDDMLAFEGLMTDELIDWIRISAHDALELGP